MTSFNYQRLAKKVKLSSYYKNLTKRKYREVKDYYSWEDICVDLASLMIVNSNIEGTVLDQTSKLVGYLGYKTELVSAPVYLVDKELLTSLSRVELPEDLITEDLSSIAPYLYFILPKGFIKDNVGQDIKGIGVIFSNSNSETFLNKEGKNIFISGTPDGKKRISIVGFAVSSYSISSPLPFSKEEIIGQVDYTSDKKSFTAGVMSKEDHDLMYLLTNIVIQLLLILKYKEDLIVEDKPSTIGLKAKDRIAQGNLLNPKWIGKGFKVIRKRSRITDSDKRKRNINPDNYPYWVSGHWRRVPIGKREEGKRIRKLIEPYIVLSPLSYNIEEQ